MGVALKVSLKTSGNSPNIEFLIESLTVADTEAGKFRDSTSRKCKSCHDINKLYLTSELANAVVSCTNFPKYTRMSASPTTVIPEPLAIAMFVPVRRICTPA